MSETLYVLCPFCKNEGSVAVPGRKKTTCPMCKPMRVVETGWTVRQVEAALARGKRREENAERVYEPDEQPPIVPGEAAPEGGAS